MGKVRCLKCGEVLESTWVHDFKMCKCPNETYVDGGHDYLRIGGMDLNLIEVLDDFKTPLEEEISDCCTGC